MADISTTKDIFPITKDTSPPPDVVNGFRVVSLKKETLEKYSSDFNLSHISSGEKFSGIVLLDKGLIIAILSISRENGFIQALEVSEKYRGRGLGSALLKVARENFHSTHLTVNKKNKAAISLYLKEGWYFYASSKAMYFMVYGDPGIDTLIHDGSVYNLGSLTKATESLEVRDFLVSKLSWILEFDDVKEDRLKLAKVDEPILIVNWRSRMAVIDGLHRLKIAVDKKLKYIPGKLVPLSLLHNFELK